MDNAPLVYLFQCIEEIASQFDGLANTHRPAPQRVRKRSSFHVIHHVVEQAVCLSDVVNRNDVGVTQARENASFPEEALRSDFSGNFGQQDLDGHPPVEGNVPGEEHDSHAPCRRLVLNLVVGA